MVGINVRKRKTGCITRSLPWWDAVDLKVEKGDVNPLLAAPVEEVVTLGVPGVQTRVVGGHDVAVRLLVTHVVKDTRCTHTSAS